MLITGNYVLGAEGTVCVSEGLYENSVLSAQFSSKPKTALFFTNIYFIGECIDHWIVLLSPPLLRTIGS